MAHAEGAMDWIGNGLAALIVGLELAGVVALVFSLSTIFTF